MFYSLVPAAKVQVIPTRAYPGWQKPIVHTCIWEYYYDDLSSKLCTLLHVLSS